MAILSENNFQNKALLDISMTWSKLLHIGHSRLRAAAHNHCLAMRRMARPSYRFVGDYRASTTNLAGIRRRCALFFVVFLPQYSGNEKYG
jgi:hypothetical protein